MIRFIHSADFHLGTVFEKIDYEKASILRQEMKEHFLNLIEDAKNKEVDFLLVSGDLFEQEYVSLSTIGFINDAFKSLKKIQVILLPGNHDPYVDPSFYTDYSWAKNVYILAGKDEKIRFKDKNVVFYGSAAGKEKSEKYDFEFKKPKKKHLNVLLLHGTVDMKYMNTPFNKISSKELKKLGFDYVALGHFHSRLEGFKDYDRIYNPGSLYPLSFDEGAEHGYYYVELDEDKEPFITYFESKSRKFHHLHVELKGCSTKENCINGIKEELAKVGNENDLYLITLKGTIDVGMSLNNEDLNSELMKEYFYVRVEDETKPDIDIESILSEPGIKGVFARKIYQQILDEPDENIKRNLFKSLHYGLKALDKKLD